MFDAFILIFLTLEIFTLIKVDQQIYGTYYTPISFLGIPYLIIIFLSYFFAPFFGFYELYTPSILVWIFGLFIFWFSGFILANLILKGNLETSLSVPDIEESAYKFLKILTTVVILIVTLKLLITLRTYPLTSKEFEKNYISVGVVAHIANFMKVLIAVHIILLDKTHKTSLLYIILMIVLLVFYQTKSWIFIPIIAGMIGRFMSGKSSFSIKYLIYISFFIILTFAIIYYFSVGIHISLTHYVKFISYYIFLYFVAGVQSLSEYIKSGMKIGINIWYIFQTPVNFINIISGNKADTIISNLWTPISNSRVFSNVSNVKTLFGTIYVYGGVVGGIIATFFFGLLYYLLLMTALIKRHVIILSIYGIWSSFLLFGWFEIYFHNINFFELPVIGFLILILSKVFYKSFDSKN